MNWHYLFFTVAILKFLCGASYWISSKIVTVVGAAFKMQSKGGVEKLVKIEDVFEDLGIVLV